MPIKLSIVGMYFGLVVEVPDGSNMSQVMDAARVQSVGSKHQFDYTPSSHGFLSNVTIIHRDRAKSRNSPRTYDPGVYSLTDDETNGNPQLVWQYYLFDKDDQRKEPRGSEIPFMMNKTPLVDGDQIVWRAVAIFNGPTSSGTAKERTKEYIGS